MHGQVERREVKWSSLYINYEPDQIPSEWRMWLRKLREDAPTEAEMVKSEEKAAELRARVEKINEQDAMRRKRAASQQPDMKSVFQKISRE